MHAVTNNKILFPSVELTSLRQFLSPWREYTSPLLCLGCWRAGKIPPWPRRACRGGKKRTVQAHPHNSDTKPLQMQALLLVLSSSGLCAGSQYCVLFSYFHLESPGNFQEPWNCPSSLSLLTHCTGGERHLACPVGFGVLTWCGLSLLPGSCHLLCLEETDKGRQGKEAPASWQACLATWCRAEQAAAF